MLSAGDGRRVDAGSGGQRLQLGLNYLVALLSGFVTMNVAPVITLVIAGLAIDRSTAGVILAAGVLSHTLVQPVGGQIVDTLGARSALALAALVGAVSCAMTAMAFSVEGLIVARLVSGVSSGIAFIAGVSLVANVPVLSPSVRQGIFGACFHLGIMVALFAVAPLVTLVGWVPAYGAMAASLGAVAIALALFLRNPEVVASGPSVGWRKLAVDPRLHGLALAHTLCYGIYMAIIPWIVDYLVSTYGGDLTYMASISTVVAVGALLARVAGGYASGRWGEGRVLLYSIGGTVALTVLLGGSPGVWLSLAGLVGIGITSSLPFGSVFSLANSEFGKGVGGRAMSLVSLSANGGALILPLLVGQLAAATGGFSVSFYALAGIELAVLAYIMFSPARRSVLLRHFSSSRQ